MAPVDQLRPLRDVLDLRFFPLCLLDRLARLGRLGRWPTFGARGDGRAGSVPCWSPSGFGGRWSLETPPSRGGGTWGWNLLMYACWPSVHTLLVNQYSTTPSGKIRPENSTLMGIKYSMTFCTVAAVPSGTVACPRRTRICVKNVAAALTSTSTIVTTRVEVRSPPSCWILSAPSRNDAANGAPNSFAVAALCVSCAVNEYRVSFGFPEPAGMLTELARWRSTWKSEIGICSSIGRQPDSGLKPSSCCS